MQITRDMEPIAKARKFTYNHLDGYDHLDTISMELSEVKGIISFDVDPNKLTLTINRKGKNIVSESMTIPESADPMQSLAIFFNDMRLIIRHFNNCFNDIKLCQK